MRKGRGGRRGRQHRTLLMSGLRMASVLGSRPCITSPSARRSRCRRSAMVDLRPVRAGCRRRVAAGGGRAPGGLSARLLVLRGSAFSQQSLLRSSQAAAVFERRRDEQAHQSNSLLGCASRPSAVDPNADALPPACGAAADHSTDCDGAPLAAGWRRAVGGIRSRLLIKRGAGLFAVYRLQREHDKGVISYHNGREKTENRTG